MQSEEIEFEVVKLKDNIPKVPCVYFLMNDIELCYIGQTVNLKKRIGQHDAFFNPNIYLGDKLVVPHSFDNIYYYVVKDKYKRRELEIELIYEYLPKWNYEGMYSTISMGVIHPDLRPCNHR